MKQLLCFVLAFGVLATPSFADEKKEEGKAAAAEEKKDEGKAAPEGGGAGLVTCKQGKTERTIENKKKEGGGCEVVYTKDGTPATVANATADLSHCDTVQNKIKSNLEGAGYTCTAN